MSQRSNDHVRGKPEDEATILVANLEYMYVHVYSYKSTASGNYIVAKVKGYVS